MEQIRDVDDLSSVGIAISYFAVVCAGSAATRDEERRRSGAVKEKSIVDVRGEIRRIRRRRKWIES